MNICFPACCRRAFPWTPSRGSRIPRSSWTDVNAGRRVVPGSARDVRARRGRDGGRGREVPSARAPRSPSASMTGRDERPSGVRRRIPATPFLPRYINRRAARPSRRVDTLRVPRSIDGVPFRIAPASEPDVRKRGPPSAGGGGGRIIRALARLILVTSILPTHCSYACSLDTVNTFQKCIVLLGAFATFSFFLIHLSTASASIWFPPPHTILMGITQGYDPFIAMSIHKGRHSSNFVNCIFLRQAMKINHYVLSGLRAW